MSKITSAFIFGDLNSKRSLEIFNSECFESSVRLGRARNWRLIQGDLEILLNVWTFKGKIMNLPPPSLSLVLFPRYNLPFFALFIFPTSSSSFVPELFCFSELGYDFTVRTAPSQTALIRIWIWRKAHHCRRFKNSLKFLMKMWAQKFLTTCFFTTILKCVSEILVEPFSPLPAWWHDFARVPQTMSIFEASLSRHVKLRDHLNLASSYTSLTCKLVLFCSSETAIDAKFRHNFQRWLHWKTSRILSMKRDL